MTELDRNKAAYKLQNFGREKWIDFFQTYRTRTKKFPP